MDKRGCEEATYATLSNMGFPTEIQVAFGLSWFADHGS